MSGWEELRQECLACRACILHETRSNVVFGAGDPHAQVMFVGEGPGANEDKQGEPFVGAAGKLLDDMMELIGLRRGQVYITNTVKCRPPGNRDPLATEKDICRSYLERQIALIGPKIIVCLGRISAMDLIRSDFKITREHGQFFEKNGMYFTALYHPAALLRDPEKKPETFVDLKALRKMIQTHCPNTKLDF